MDLAVYNYLVPQYIQRPVTKYDTHNRKELRAVLKDMMKLNDTQSPTWLVKLSDEKQTYALNIKEESIALFASLSSLSDSGDGAVFSQKKAYTGNDSITAKIVTEDYEKLPEEFDLKVNSLAKQQVNQGNSYYRTGKGLAAGTYRFNLSVNDDVYEFQFNIKKDANHEEIGQELANFINKAGVGVTASVQYDGKDKISLVLEARMSGRGTHGNVFALQDLGTGKGKGIVSYYNLNQMVQEPKNASFMINGENKESLSNSFILNQALYVTLKGATDEEVHVGYLPDSDKIIESIKEMMTGYNGLIEFTKEYTEKKGYVPKLANELSAVVRPHHAEMESCGITLDTDRKMQLDESLAVQACNEGDMQDLFSESSPLVSKLLDKTNDVKLNPMEYVDKTLVTYPDKSKPGVTRSYITSLYSGMLFNDYC